MVAVPEAIILLPKAEVLYCKRNKQLSKYNPLTLDFTNTSNSKKRKLPADVLNSFPVLIVKSLVSEFVFLNLELLLCFVVKKSMCLL